LEKEKENLDSQKWEELTVNFFYDTVNFLKPSLYNKIYFIPSKISVVFEKINHPKISVILIFKCNINLFFLISVVLSFQYNTNNKISFIKLLFS